MSGCLGLDLSVTSTGWSTTDSCGLIKTMPSMVLGARFAVIRSSLNTVLGTVMPDLAIIEEAVTHGLNGDTIIKMAGVHAIVCEELHAWGIPRVLVAPALLKKWATGAGKADKAAMIAAAQSEGYTGKQSDEADAWHLAQVGKALMGATVDPHRAALLANVKFPDGRPTFG